MEDQFIANKTYKFEVVGMRPTGYGTNYIYLRRGERDTYRVKPYPFQEEDPENLPKEMLCMVSRIDAMSGLPVLWQDKVSLFKQLFHAGEEEVVKVTGILTDDRTQATYYQLTDTYGIEHRFYYTGEPRHQRFDVFSLKIERIDEQKGVLLFAEIPVVKDVIIEEPGLTKIKSEEEPSTFGAEGIHTEFKSSIAFVPGQSTADIDKQLKTITRTIAGFMNADGGTLWIGVNDSGSITGIEADFEYLNSGEDDFNGSYKITPDSYELKIRNAMNRSCNGAAGSKSQFKFYTNSSNKLYCGIDINRSNTPIFINGTFLFQRAGNQVLQLRGDEITNFIKERCSDEIKGFISQHLETTLIRESTDKPVSGSTEVKISVPFKAQPPDPNDEVWNYFTFYKDGKWSFQKNAVASDEVERELPVMKSQKQYPMLMCYNNGYINAIIPSEIRSGKDRGKLYANGWNTEAILMNIFISAPYNLIAAFSQDHEGINRVKVHSVTDFSIVKSIRGKGAMIVNPGIGVVSGYKLVNIENKMAIPGLIMEKRFTSQSLGFRLTDPNLRKEIEFMDKL